MTERNQKLLAVVWAFASCLSVMFGLSGNLFSFFGISCVLYIIPVALAYILLGSIKNPSIQFSFAIIISICFAISSVINATAPSSDPLGPIALLTMPFFLSGMLIVSALVFWLIDKHALSTKPD